MRRNRFDRIGDRMLSRIERVTDGMTREFKDTNPYDKEPVSDEELMDTLSEDEINEAIGGRR